MILSLLSMRVSPAGFARQVRGIMECIVLTATHTPSYKEFIHDCNAHALVEQYILADSKMKLLSCRTGIHC
jgi:hypothetical protein